MTDAPPLMLYNTLSRKKEAFEPIDPADVRMYVCGPTVYDYAHIGNARPIIVFDVLFRLLRHRYGPEHVTYARNITDVDDKINARALERYPEMPPVEAIRRLTVETTEQFHKDISALGVLEPTVEPRATDHIVEMVALCEALLGNGHAYIAQDHVLFHVPSMPDYGRLSGRALAEMEAGSRVAVESYKRDPMDFVLWKPSEAGEPAWPSPKGVSKPGRPGWHIECSAMAEKHLGTLFDIHGGGLDLIFPHHENEIAQSRCAHGTPVMANIWMHNGFLQVEGDKMSKSQGNFVTVNELVRNRWDGRVLRFAMLKTHYRQPINWTRKGLQDATWELDGFAKVRRLNIELFADEHCSSFVDALSDDLNTPKAISELHLLASKAVSGATGIGGDEDIKSYQRFHNALNLLGFDLAGFDGDAMFGRMHNVDARLVDALIAARLGARRAKNWAESDRIRDELAAMGIALKDSKDPATGEIVTNWEVKR